MTKRYQDYVIKDGKLVGKFEEMYREFDSPWQQTETEQLFSKSRHTACLNIRKFGIRSVVEFGSGLGYTSDMIQRATGANVLGIDISETAVKKAKDRFPQIEFRADSVENIERYANYDAILFAEITWYILPQLTSVFEKMLKHFSGKYFLHNLVFYKGNTQQYGKEYFRSLDEFVSYCPFRLLESTISTMAEENSTIETSTIFKIEKK